MNPALFKFGSLEIRYYGILFALSFLFGYFILKKLFKKSNLNEKLVDDYIFYIFLGVIIGARIFEVAFYEPFYYLNNPIKIFYIFQGGLSSHGAIAGSILANYLFCKKHKINFYKTADIAVIPFFLGASLIRIGNFINGEIVGRITNVPWAVKFSNYEGLRHPSQIYESIKNLIIFTTLFVLSAKKQRPGYLFWLGLLLFSIFRFGVEFFKEYPLYYGLTIGQYLTIPLFILSLIMFKKITTS